MPPDERLTLRLARIEDLESTGLFYQHYAHRYIDPRRPEVLEQTVVGGGQLLLVDDCGRIVGASALYELAAGVRELGSVRIAGPGGFGLFEYMSAAQILRHFERAPATAVLLMNIDVRNTAVIARSERLGWTPIAPDPAILSLHERTLAGPMQAPCWWGVFPPDRVAACLAKLRSLADPYHALLSRDGSQRLSIDLRLPDIAGLR